MKSENKKIIIWIFAIIVIIAILYVLIPWIRKSRLNAQIQAEMQTLSETSAAEYCKNSGGTLEMKTDESGVYGMCNFEDGSACEIVEYFRGECLSASEQDEGETLYCSDGSVCEDEEADDLSSRIEDMNNIENLDGEVDDEVVNGDDLDELDFDSLYDYYENEFTNSGEESGNGSMGKLKSGEGDEGGLSSACDSVGGTILGDRCYLSNGVEIVF